MSQAIKQFVIRLSLILIACLLNNTAVFAQGCPPGASWCSGTYVYDGMGNIRAIGADTYVYDTAGRLVSGTADVNRTGIVSRQDYSYDAFGNRTSASRAAGSIDCLGGCELSPTIDPATNHITSNGAVYDAAGNLTFIQNTVNNVIYSSTYVYDAVGSMVRATAGSDDREFIYTADDERIATRNGQNWTWTVRDLDNKVLREFTSLEPNGQPGLPTQSRQWAKDYVWRDGLLLASVTPTTPGATTTFTEHFHLDHLGTPRLVSNDAGVRIGIHAYYPFGAELNLSPNEQPAELMKFTGHERDLLASNPNTLDYMHARYDMGTMGRFLSVDPVIDFKRAMTHPQVWNRYGYVENNPVLLTDPNGKCPLCVLIAVGVVGGILLNGDVANAPSPNDHPIPNEGPASAIGGAMKALTAWGSGNAITRGITQSLDSGNKQPTLRFGEKVEKQLGNRGWNKASVEKTVNDPSRTQAAMDTRNLPGGGKMNDPATVYFDRQGNYVVVNNKSGDIVQVSNRNDPNWLPPVPKQ